MAKDLEARVLIELCRIEIPHEITTGGEEYSFNRTL